MDSVSLNTLKSLTNPRSIRGIATLKEVERFRKEHFERYRELNVKLIEKLIAKLIDNYTPNKLFIYSKANSILSHANTYSTKDFNAKCAQSCHDERKTIGSISSEEDTTSSKPCVCDSQRKAFFIKMTSSFIIIMVNMLLLLSFLLQGSMLCFTCLIVVTLLGCITATFFHWYTQTVMVITL